MTDTVYVELLPEHPAFGKRDEAADALAPAHPGDAGIDLIACESTVLAPGGRALVSAGIRIALPTGVEAQVRPRSGQAWKKGLTVANAPGTVDPGYRGPIKVILLNTASPVTAEDLSDDDPEVLRSRLLAGMKCRTVTIERGERIAQLVFNRFERPAIEIVGSVSQDTRRGAGGFGSTGSS